MPTTETTIPRHVLVLGGYGATGSGVVDAASRHDGFRVSTAGRRAAPKILLNGRAAPPHFTIDLMQTVDAGTKIDGLSDVTDLVFCAYAHMPTMAECVAPNVAMLTNILSLLAQAGAPLQRVVLTGGGKSYGPHLGPYKTPAKESDPRVMGPIFYEDQEGVLRDWSAKTGGSWTVVRPDGVVGLSLGSPMNLITGIATFALVSKQRGLALRFPGSFDAWNALHQVTDADIFGDAVFWALGSDEARNEIFNVTNGDNFRWKHLWHDIAGFFDMAVEEPQPMSLVTQMADKEADWNLIVEQHGLVPTVWSDIASWPFLDAIFNIPFDMVQSTIKVRQAGFGDCIDTHQSFLRHLARLRSARLIP